MFSKVLKKTLELEVMRERRDAGSIKNLSSLLKKVYDFEENGM